MSDAKKFELGSTDEKTKLLYICREQVEIKKQQFVYGNKEKCSKACAEFEWCKSFDMCENNNQQYCHLKDKDRKDYDKLQT